MNNIDSKYLNTLEKRLAKIERTLSKVQKYLEADEKRQSSILKDLQKLTLGFSTTWLYGIGLAWILAGIGLLVADVPTVYILLAFITGFCFMMMAGYLRLSHR